MTARQRGGPPKKVMAPAATTGATTTTTKCSQHSESVAERRRRRAAAWRSPVLWCGCCKDPHTNKHRGGPAPWGYAAAAKHLADRGLLPAPPADVEQLRDMWRDGDRELATQIAAEWAVGA